jgi:hypothetical protein
VIELTQKELHRLKVNENAVAGHISVGKAASLLGLSARQEKRLKRRCQAGEVEWVRHGNRGRKKPWRLPEAVRRKVQELAKGKYAGFNDSHLTEKLQEKEHLLVSRESVADFT